MDLRLATADALDVPALRAALADRARTSMGRAAVGQLAFETDTARIAALLDEVGEVLALEGDGAWIPVGEVADVREPAGRAGRGAVLEGPELRLTGRTLEALDRLADHLLSAEADIPRLRATAGGLSVDRGVTAALVAAFDEQGQLSARTYPELGALRQRIADTHAAIRATLEEMVRSDDLADALQDRFVTQRGDRWVLPVKAGWKRKELGIVHGMSGSGQTAFVEPHQVVALNNALRYAEGELEAAERRILTALSAALGRVAHALLDALDAATHIDLAVARAALSADLRATRPVVRQQGEVHLAAARHPLLALRGLEVVANDLHLGAATPVLVVSGPNTGGKTVALKTLGLCALLVRLGCYVPAAEGSRVDAFPTVGALIGDHQTVQGDQSSFSAHLIGLRAMLDAAGPGALFLVDEIASGTDPVQGASLAHAVLERFLERGARALITTHFHRLKTLSALDGRFAIAGMAFEAGRPTYRLVAGASGASHAFEIAARVGLDDTLLARARALMGEEERGLSDLLEAIDAQRARAAEAAARADALEREAAALRERLAAKERALDARARELERERAATFQRKLDEAEAALAAVVAGLQRAPSHAGVEGARTTVAAMRGWVPTPTEAPPPATADGPSSGPAPGGRVRVHRLGKPGDVLEATDKLVVVRVGPLTLRLKPSEVTPLDDHGHERPPPPKPAPSATAPPPPVDLADAARFPGNTVDLRGLRVDEGLTRVEQFLDRALREQRPVVFVLHGHGTGAMKAAVRRWLPECPLVASSRPANADQGGDAYTVVALR